jgi:cellulose synthase/poly-beta-1,6-N-acetylglucosamine synthase-like glycosyltransferase
MYDKHNEWTRGLTSTVSGFHNEDIREFYDWEHEMFDSTGRTDGVNKIAVITPTVCSRTSLLEECKQSVLAQTWKGEIFHAIGVDSEKEGAAKTRNRIVRGLEPSYDWLVFCDDDDKLLPDHIATLVSASNGADVVYSNCQEEGFTKTWNTREFNYDAVKEANYIPVTVLMRRSMFEKVGGFQSEPYPGEDQHLWLRAALAGARFVYVPQTTWLYRKHPQHRET